MNVRLTASEGRYETETFDEDFRIRYHRFCSRKHLLLLQHELEKGYLKSSAEHVRSHFAVHIERIQTEIRHRDYQTRVKFNALEKRLKDLQSDLFTEYSKLIEMSVCRETSVKSKYYSDKLIKSWLLMWKRFGAVLSNYLSIAPYGDNGRMSMTQYDAIDLQLEISKLLAKDTEFKEYLLQQSFLPIQLLKVTKVVSSPSENVSSERFAVTNEMETIYHRFCGMKSWTSGNDKRQEVNSDDFIKNTVFARLGLSWIKMESFRQLFTNQSRSSNTLKRIDDQIKSYCEFSTISVFNDFVYFALEDLRKLEFEPGNLAPSFYKALEVNFDSRPYFLIF